MNELVKNTPNMVSPQLLNNTRISLSLSGWPCAVAIMSVCAACVLVYKINAESKALQSASTMVE